MNWSMLIPLIITLFCFWGAHETHGFYSNWWSAHLPLAIGVSALAWLIWWVV